MSLLLFTSLPFILNNDTADKEGIKYNCQVRCIAQRFCKLMVHGALTLLFITASILVSIGL